MKVARIKVDPHYETEETGWQVWIYFADGSMITNEPDDEAMPKVMGPTDSYRMIGYLLNLAEDLRAAGKL